MNTYFRSSLRFLIRRRRLKQTNQADDAAERRSIACQVPNVPIERLFCNLYGMAISQRYITREGVLGARLEGYSGQARCQVSVQIPCTRHWDWDSWAVSYARCPSCLSVSVIRYGVWHHRGVGESVSVYM